MKGGKHFWGLGVAAAPAISLFVAQTVLIGQGNTGAVSALAHYGGLLGLVFFVFDGQSGLGPAMLALRHDENTIRAAYRLYRIVWLLAFLLVLLLLFLMMPSLQFFLLALLISLLLRLRPLDHDLDRRDWQHWGMLAQNAWMIALAVATLWFGRLDAVLAGYAAVFGTAPYALLHRGRPGTAHFPAATKTRQALADLLALMLAQGLGQLYGRAMLFTLGAGFSGPIAALAIYAKQVFNAAGLLVLYLRRLELRTERPTMRLSLGGQAGIALVGSVAVIFAASRLDLSAAIIMALIVWQILEKLSATRIYALQLSQRHSLAFQGLVLVMVSGALGLALAAASGTVLGFIALESLGYVAALALGARLRPWFLFSREAGRP